MKNFDLDIPKMGYIIAFRKKRKDFIGDSIYKFQKAKGYKEDDAQYTHVEISSGGDDSMRITPPKARPVNISKYYSGHYIRILKLKPNIKIYDRKLRYKIMGRYNLLCNLAYDKMGIGRFILPFLPHSRKKPFCSEGVCSTYQHYIPEFCDGVEPHDCMPATIVAWSGLQIHWEGYIPGEIKESFNLFYNNKDLGFKASF